MTARIEIPDYALGPYPQRQDKTDRGLDAAAARLGSVFARRLALRRGAIARFVARVGHAGKGLRGTSDEELGRITRELRHELRRDGLRQALVAKAFALVREQAERSLGMRHYDVQIAGGWVLVNGRVAEMETGEGKTLTATLAAATASLAGVPVHVITVNDYLAGRDASEMKPLYESLGLSVGVIQERMGGEERRHAYGCDICYCTNKQLAFDYLRDRLLLGEDSGALRLRTESLYRNRSRLDQTRLRGLFFAIVDEADSVLVDEARTPLVISREAEDQGTTAYYSQAIALARDLLEGRDFRLDRVRRHVAFSTAGEQRLAALSARLGGVWVGNRLRRELVEQALTALYLFDCDDHYLVRDGKVQIIDPYTGRLMADRSWERGLHQMVEAKEGCALTVEKQTLAKISYQRLFRRYLHLCGMTGTARDVAGELAAVYKLGTVVIPTHRPLRRHYHGIRMYAGDESRWEGVMRAVQRVHQCGRPVLVGTRAVESSEHLSQLLTEAGLDHQVLNARQDADEAAVVARAGEPGRITVATSMAGRGTDIRLGSGVSQLGGLHVIAAEPHEARRIDRQLFGRCARQGDPGGCEAAFSTSDPLVRLHCPWPLRAWLIGCEHSRILVLLSQPIGRMALYLAQRRLQRRHAVMRRELLRQDHNRERMLAFSGRGE